MLGVSRPGVDELGQRQQVGMVLLGDSIVSRWRTNERHQGARRLRPKPPVMLPLLSPPTMTRLPVGLRARRRRRSGVLPAMSRIRS